jgi:hypothetical protein
MHISFIFCVFHYFCLKYGFVEEKFRKKSEAQNVGNGISEA